MIWLILSVVFSTGLFLAFKVFSRNKILLFPAITVNYLTCFICGNIISFKNDIPLYSFADESWFWKVATMGLLFICAFSLTGLGTANAGAGPTSVASKMSVVLPLLYSIIFFEESLKIIQMAGMLLALGSVYLMSVNKTSDLKQKKRNFWILLAVFVSSGMVDTGLGIIHKAYSGVIPQFDFTISTVIFGAAACVGIAILIVNRKLRSGMGMKEILGGVVLGLINYISLVCLFAALKAFSGETSKFWAINNVGVVMLSTLLSLLFFSEKLHRMKAIGLGLAVLGILLMYMNW